MAAHMPVEEDKKLAPHHVALINSTGIKRGTTEGTDMKGLLPDQTQKKARMEEHESEGGTRSEPT